MTEPGAVTHARELIAMYDECCRELCGLGCTLSGIHGVPLRDRSAPKGFIFPFHLACDRMKALAGIPTRSELLMDEVLRHTSERLWGKP